MKWNEKVKIGDFLHLSPKTHRGERIRREFLNIGANEWKFVQIVLGIAIRTFLVQVWKYM